MNLFRNSVQGNARIFTYFPNFLSSVCFLQNPATCPTHSFGIWLFWSQLLFSDANSNLNYYFRVFNHVFIITTIKITLRFNSFALETWIHLKLLNHFTLFPWFLSQWSFIYSTLSNYKSLFRVESTKTSKVEWRCLLWYLLTRHHLFLSIIILFYVFFILFYLEIWIFWNYLWYFYKPKFIPVLSLWQYTTILCYPFLFLYMFLLDDHKIVCERKYCLQKGKSFFFKRKRYSYETQLCYSMTMIQSLNLCENQLHYL